MAPSPFDEAKIKALVEGAGLTHQPGMATHILGDVAPLLADEGINLGSFGGNIAQLDSALARATERYNLALFTPMGTHRSGAITVLRMFAQARADGDLDRAHSILANVQPDADEPWPAVSHVIGAGLGLLDEWSRRADLKRALGTVKPQPWSMDAGKAARQILAAARRGAAFAGIDELIRRFGGLVVLQGTAVAIAAVIRAVAMKRKISVVEACDLILPGEDSLDEDGALTADDYRVIDQFRAWFAADDPYSEQSEIDNLTGIVSILCEMARERDLNPHDPQDIQPLIELIDKAVPEEEAAVRNSLLRALDEYVHFQLETTKDPDGWEDAHALVEQALSPTDNPLLHLFQELMAGAATTADERQAALSALPVVSAVPQLLTWIGRGRPASPSGATRRSDIESVAALLGVAAVGVNRRSREPLTEEELELKWDPVASLSTPLEAMSMNEVPELSAWWAALTHAEIIEPAASRLRPGAEAVTWLSNEGPTLDAMETVASIFTARLITHEMETSRSEFFLGWDTMIARMVLMRLVAALTPEDGGLSAPEPGPLEILAPRTDRVLAELARQGIIVLGQDGTVEIPAGLRLMVVRSVLAAGAALSGAPDNNLFDELDEL